MIKFVKGNLFDSNADILVCTINCVGVMGAGIAKEFKERYPAYYYDYKSKCASGHLVPGAIFDYHNLYCGKDLESYYKDGEPKYIISASTKDHWKDPSNLEWIDSILDMLRDSLLVFAKIPPFNSFKSIAIPALGCSNGKLNWADVKPLMEKYLGDIEWLEIIVYEPRA